MKNSTDKPVTICECGCGQATKGGKFCPGHNAKMRSHLLAQAISGSKTAVKQLETYGWTKYLLQKQERIAARVKAVEPKTPIKLNNGKKHQ